ncbi:enhancer of filamentation 1 [Planococcus citri]|uniref:enhancer of filamentation 1 n=1 Tax=Planococcus citri TaxID=170843 RepID=UPI0031F8A6E2
MLQILNDSFSQNHVARALYDNIAESADELPFKKGDLLTVLEQNTGGLQGWWLCSFKGRQGICPGNRLQLLAGNRNGQKSNDMCNLNNLQEEGRRFSWHVLQSSKVSASALENVIDPFPYERNLGGSGGCEDADCRYDVLPCGQPIPLHANSHYSSPVTSKAFPTEVVDGYSDQDKNNADDIRLPGTANECSSQRYDIPRSIKPIAAMTPLSPTTSISSLTSSPCESVCNSNRSSVIPDYDVPRARPISSLHSQLMTMSENDGNSSAPACYDVPLQIARELPLELSSAIENLEQLQNEIMAAVNTLLSYATPLWRQPDQLGPKLMDIKLVVLRLQSALHDLSKFGEGVLGNALNASDKGLVQKLCPLTKTLFETNNVVQQCVTYLENCNWSVQVLAKDAHSPDNVDRKCGRGFDSLDQLIVCARSLTEDVRRFSSFVQGNATLLFKRNSIDNRDPKNDKLSNKDGDYINFEAHKTLNRMNSEVRSLLSHDMRNSFDLLIKEAETGNVLAQFKSPDKIDLSDKQVLSFYAAQCSTHFLHLTHAIDAFLNTVERNQPPKVFLAHGKFVILSAHRLVHIGDTVHQNISCVEINSQVSRLSDDLSEALATAVREIKKAAVQFPSVVAVQQMVNSVVRVSHSAKNLKMCIVFASHT